jgi:hypothetical protein
MTCSWATQPPTPVSSSVVRAGAAVSVAASSWSGAYKLLGTADGQVRLEEAGPAPRCVLHLLTLPSVLLLARLSCAGPRKQRAPVRSGEAWGGTVVGGITPGSSGQTVAKMAYI